VESRERPAPERALLHHQFVMMERRLWKVITVPAMIFTLVFGTRLAMLRIGDRSFGEAVAAEPWLGVKIGLVLLLVGYHHVCGRILRQLKEERCRWTSGQLRQWNELATLLLVAIIMVAVLKSLFDALWGTLALVALGIVLALAVRVMKNRWAKRPVS
jgi:putative membrane protein